MIPRFFDNNPRPCYFSISSHLRKSSSNIPFFHCFSWNDYLSSSFNEIIVPSLDVWDKKCTEVEGQYLDFDNYQGTNNMQRNCMKLNNLFYEIKLLLWWLMWLLYYCIHIKILILSSLSSIVDKLNNQYQACIPIISWLVLPDMTIIFDRINN